MNPNHLAGIEAWFADFTSRYNDERPERQRNIDLKIEHTYKVRGVIQRLATSLQMHPDECNLASAIAICHDVGRFPQYLQFGTFNDASSVNHAILSVQTLKTENVLDALPPNLQQILFQSVGLHNVFQVPPNLSFELRKFVSLIRDADKLDIWRVIIEYCSSPREDRASAVVWELPDTGYCSEDAIAEVVSGKMLDRRFLKTADDFKLLQLSWVFDLNFADSFRILKKCGYIEKLASYLPENQNCSLAVDTVKRHMDNIAKS
jgi:hypothetical protein